MPGTGDPGRIQPLSLWTACSSLLDENRLELNLPLAGEKSEKAREGKGLV